MVIKPGVRTGKVRLGGDNPIIDDQGNSWFSFEDYVIAWVDELEKSAHKMSRFTIGLRRQGAVSEYPIAGWYNYKKNRVAGISPSSSV